MKVPFMDLKIKDEEQRKEFLNAIDNVFQHGRIILGPEVNQLEYRVSRFCDRKYAIAVNSGTTALYLSLKSLGIRKGDEVITTSLSWIATANAIAMTGAMPVFADINDDLNINPESVEKLISSKTKAIMPVHYTGKICKINDLKNIADKYNLNLIEDAAQAFGAEYKGRKAGSFGDIACFSLNPMKVFAACGEAGIILTDDEILKKKLIALRNNGMVERIECIEPGINGRMDTIQAAILLKRFDKVDEFIKRRREIAKKYTNALKDFVEIPEESTEEIHSYYTYTIKTKNNERDKLQEYLASQGIETQIQHKILMPQQKPYNTNISDNNNAEKLVKCILSLPMNETLTDVEVDYVIHNIVQFFEERLNE